MAASFDAYKIFYYVAKYGNITRAASSLFLSQSTVSRSVQSLEAELNCKLFVRYQHGVSLTAEGEMLFRHVSAGCEAFFSGEERLKALIASRNNELRIGVNDFVYQLYLIPALAEFTKLRPDVTVSVSTQRHFVTDEIYSALEDGLLDLVFAFSPTPENNTFRVQTVGEMRDILVAGSAFGEFAGKTVSLDDLKSCPFVVRTTPDGTTSFLEEVFQRRGVTITPRYRVDTITHFIPMVQSGLCLAMLPETAFAEMRDTNGIFALRLAEPLPPRKICIVTSNARSVGAAGDELIRCFRRKLRSQIV